jgi:hypothetical protein
MPKYLCIYCTHPVDPRGDDTAVVSGEEGGNLVQYAQSGCRATAINKPIETDFKEDE